MSLPVNAAGYPPGNDPRPVATSRGHVAELLRHLVDQARELQDQLADEQPDAGRPAIADQPAAVPELPGAVVARGQLEVRARLKTLVESATRSLSWSRHGLGAVQWGGIRTISAQTSRSLEVRVLLGLDRADIATAVRTWQKCTWQGTHLRVLPPGGTPVEFLVVDGAHACLSSLDEHGEPVLREITDPAIVQSLTSSFALAWAGAAELDETENLAGLLEAPVTRAVLRMLVDGAKDETIARTAGISLRTCRRHAAAIMSALTSTSRFQAGYNLGRAHAMADLLGQETTAVGLRSAAQPD